MLGENTVTYSLQLPWNVEEESQISSNYVPCSLYYYMCILLLPLVQMSKLGGDSGCGLTSWSFSYIHVLWCMIQAHVPTLYYIAKKESSKSAIIRKRGYYHKVQ